MVAINMEIPSCCGECNLTICKGKDEPWNYCCSITLTNINLDNTERPSDCPLVEIGTCKDCKYVSQNDDNDRYCGLSGGYYDPNYYCVDFEKRGNENGSN